MSISTDFKHDMNLSGFAFLHEHAVGKTTLEAFSMIGSVTTLVGFHSVQSLAPKELAAAAPNTYSGNFGTGEFPLHTDLAHWAVPPRYIGLRCVKGAFGVFTRLLDGTFLIDTIGYMALRRTLVQPRRPLKGSKQLLRLLDVNGASGCQVLRWDQLFLGPATSKSMFVHAQIRQLVDAVIPMDVALLNPGDTLVIDNWRMLHGRSSTPEYAVSRLVDRVYLGDLH